MKQQSITWSPDWKLKPGEILDTPSALECLDYCLEWRQWLWRKPAIHLLDPFEQFQGKRVLEFGYNSGKMSCLLAAAGAEVTGIELNQVAMETARKEAELWGVENRTNFEIYDGNYRNLPAGKFDIIFSKSSLVMTQKKLLAELFYELNQRLAPGGNGLFLENCYSWLLDKVRQYFIHRYATNKYYHLLSWGFSRKQIDMMGKAFGSINANKYRGLVWAIKAGQTIT
ncbi:MAG: class I SAM-dependent methyltransferase [Planctomycetota bacterium]|jgi:SAM-dependent methyltransferase